MRVLYRGSPCASTLWSSSRPAGEGTPSCGTTARRSSFGSWRDFSPSTLRQLVPDFKEKGAPLAADVREDRVYFLTRSSQLKFPITPPPLQNHGNYIISLNRFVKWLAGLVEGEGIDIFAGFPASEVLYDGDRVAGD